MLTNLGHLSTRVFRVALVVALGATLAALAVVALIAASGTAVGQQQGQEPPPRKVRSPQQSRGEHPNQSRARKGTSRLQSGSLVSMKV
jgi:hypothetical protein